MIIVPTVLKASPVEGVGVFAAAPVKSGELVWIVDPAFDKIIATDRHFPPAIMRWLLIYGVPYAHDDDVDQIYVDIDNARFMNHSATPNCAPAAKIGEGRAVRDIAVGEEITVDYGSFGGTRDFATLHAFDVAPYATLRDAIVALKAVLRD